MNKKSNSIARIIFLVLAIAVAITIFMFSSQDADKSSDVSEGVAKKVIDILPKTKNLSEVEKKKLVKKSQKLVRKLAHFSIYAILGINIMLFLKTFSLVKNKQMLLTLLACLIYAVLDEIHQFFSDGRTPLITDVCIDVLGGVLGASIIFFPSYIFNKIRTKKINKNAI